MSKQHNERERYVGGRRAVFEALQANVAIEKIYIVHGADDPTVHRLRAAADRAGVMVSTMDKRKFGALERELGLQVNDAQGVIALRPPREPLTLEALIETAKTAERPALLVALDGITDPHNLGAIARSAEAAGALGLIVPEQHSAPVTPVAVKASAGALEHLGIAKVKRISTTLKLVREAGITVVGTTTPADKAYTDVDLTGPVCIVIGSEGEGLHERVLQECSHVVHIPMLGQIASLNASVAAGVLLFEVVRQRRVPGA
jgi:23S rRNA (guanosine2251-2'-O)-methyltransferase